MFILKTTDATVNSQVFRPKASFVRPQSQQRPTSFNHFSPNPPRISQKSPLPHEKVEIIQQNEYYTQGKITVKEKSKPPATSAKIIHNIHQYGIESLESLRNSLYIMLEKATIKFNEQIARQSHQIKKLQKKIEYQNQEIQTKNHIIKTLINKFQRSKDGDVKNESLEFKKIEDLDRKLHILVQQIEEERSIVHRKLDNVTQKILSHIGGLLNASRTSLCQFLIKNSQRIEEMKKNVTALNQKDNKKLVLLQTELDTLRNSIKNLEEQQQIKESCSQINTSKDTASHNSSMSSNKNKKQDLFLSDYFFHPSQNENPSIKVIQELARQREKLNQLPIRVYMDNLGRLKYLESRTFIFDRKGNFTSPTSKDLVLLEQKGWIRLVAE